MDNSCLSGMCFAHVSSQFVTCLLIILVTSFSEQKFLILIMSNISIFFQGLCLWCYICKVISSPKVIKGSACARSVCRCCGFPGWCSRGIYPKIKWPEDLRLGEQGEHVSRSDRGKGALRLQLRKGTKGWAWAGG